jgi:hypothetical protein
MPWRRENTSCPSQKSTYSFIVQNTTQLLQQLHYPNCLGSRRPSFIRKYLLQPIFHIQDYILPNRYNNNKNKGK